MQPLLQNHPETRNFPVSGWKLVFPLILKRNWYALNQKFPRPLISFYRMLLWVLCVPWLVIAVFSFDGPSRADFLDVQSLSSILLYGSLMLGIPMLFLAITYWMVQAPVREQRRYYQEAGRTPLSMEKRLALRLGITQTFDEGFWSETLEHYPIEFLVKDPNSYRWIGFVTPEASQQRLIDDWDIRSREDCFEIIHQLLQGMHSMHFQKALLEEDSDELVERLSSLTQIPINHIYQTAQSINQRPPTLVWGFDLWRIFPMIHNAFAARFLTEEESWKIWLHTADIVHETFDSFEQFNASYRLGHAFWCQDVEMTQKRLQDFLNYRQFCDWPIAQLPWPQPKERSISGEK